MGGVLRPPAMTLLNQFENHCSLLNYCFLKEGLFLICLCIPAYSVRLRKCILIDKRNVCVFFCSRAQEVPLSSTHITSFEVKAEQCAGMTSWV